MRFSLSPDKYCTYNSVCPCPGLRFSPPRPTNSVLVQLSGGALGLLTTSEPAYQAKMLIYRSSFRAQGDLLLLLLTESERHNVAFHTARDMPAVWQNARLRVLNEDVPAAALAIAHNRGFYQRHE